MTEWRTHTPQYDGHAPDDWDGKMVEFLGFSNKWHAPQKILWENKVTYRYHAKPDLLAQCLRLPQADRDALIEALQKPQRDWAEDVWSKADEAFGNDGKAAAADVIRTMCRPKEDN